MTILDAHLHLWDPDRLDYAWLSGDLARRHGPDDLAVAEAGEHVERVFVQADCRPDQARDEVRWVQSVAREAGVVGIVAFAPLDQGADRVAGLLDEYAAHPLVVGVRRLLQSEPAGFSATEAFRSAARATAERGLVFDACVRSDQLDEVAMLADAVPELSVVLDHLGKPGPGAADDAVWPAAISALAARPSVSVKLSGLPAEFGRDWRAADVEPLLDRCLAAFGVDRLLYGSDWPVSGPLPRWRDTVRRWAIERTGADGAAAIMGDNARRIYGV